MSKEIAQTIIQQLGGGKFAAMTGMKNVTYFNGGEKSRGGVTFKIGGGAKSGINYVRVTLTFMDVYTVEYLKVSPSKGTVKTIKQSDDVYCDMLQDNFIEATGFFTSL